MHVKATSVFRTSALKCRAYCSWPCTLGVCSVRAVSSGCSSRRYGGYTLYSVQEAPYIHHWSSTPTLELLATFKGAGERLFSAELLCAAEPTVAPTLLVSLHESRSLTFASLRLGCSELWPCARVPQQNFAVLVEGLQQPPDGIDTLPAPALLRLMYHLRVCF